MECTISKNNKKSISSSSSVVTMMMICVLSLLFTTSYAAGPRAFMNNNDNLLHLYSSDLDNNNHVDGFIKATKKCGEICDPTVPGNPKISKYGDCSSESGCGECVLTPLLIWPPMGVCKSQ
ncbi:hypothetical protein CsatB_002128 [Cannabis sativa]